MWAAYFSPYMPRDMLSAHCFSFSSSFIYWRSWQSTVLFLIIMIMRQQTGGHNLEVTGFFPYLPSDLIWFFSQCGWDCEPRPQSASKMLVYVYNSFCFPSTKNTFIIKWENTGSAVFFSCFLGRANPRLDSLFASDQILGENPYHEVKSVYSDILRMSRWMHNIEW